MRAARSRSRIDDARASLAGALAGVDRRRAATIALALAPPALAGLTLRRGIERRLGGPRSIAAGLAGGAVAMALADRAQAAARDATRTRGRSTGWRWGSRSRSR